ncbi:MAG: hypothetical protein R2818_11270 [Flavobacteriales bacterium]
MSVLEASFTGTVRIILILLVVWWVLRFCACATAQAGRPAA